MLQSNETLGTPEAVEQQLRETIRAATGRVMLALPAQHYPALAPDLVDAVDDYTNGRGTDVVVEASGADPAVRATTEAVRHGGTVVLVGLGDDEPVPLDVVELIHQEVDIHTSFRYANTYPTAIDLLADERVDVEGFVDFEMGLRDVDDAFQRATEAETVKGVLTL